VGGGKSTVAEISGVLRIGAIQWTAVKAIAAAQQQLPQLW
jgi:hypothetical protein